MTQPRKILIIATNGFLRSFFLNALQASGHKVELASTTAEALRMVIAGGFDLVVTDGDSLPLDRDPEALRIKEWMGPRFILIASYLSEGMARVLDTNGALRCLIKPFSFYELVKSIKYAGDKDAITDLSSNGEAGKGKQRAEKRYPWGEDCRLIEHGAYNPRQFASTSDISPSGVRVHYMGRPIRYPSAVSMEIRSLRVKAVAEVLWSEEKGREATSGLKLRSQIPSSSMTTAVQGRIFLPGKGR